MQQTYLARAHIQDCECVRVAEGNFAKTLRTSQIALPKRRGARGWRERGAVLNASGLKCPFTMSVWPASGTRRTHSRSPERQATRGRGRKRRARRSPFARTSTEQASASGVGERERERAQEGTAAQRRRRLIHLRHSQSPLRSLSGPLQRLQQFVIDGQRKDERARTCRASSIEPIRKPNCESENGERIRA